MKVTVVGTGIAGACVAFGLARRGAAVTMIDDHRPGSASAAGAGIIQPWASQASGVYYELYARGAAHYPTLIRQLDQHGVDADELGYRRTGSLVVSLDEADVDAAVDRLRRRRTESPEMGTIERSDGPDLVQHFPPLRDDLYGIVVPGGARVDVRRLVAGIRRALDGLGATSLSGTVSLTRDRDRIMVTVDDRRLDSDVLVIAAGAWAAELLAPLRRAVDVEPQRGQIVHLDLPGFRTDDWPTVVPISHHYLVPFGDGRVVAGATRETGSGFDPRVTTGGLRQVLDDAIALAPGLADGTVVEARVGLRPLAIGGIPTVGPLPGHDGVYIATGYGAGGLTMAPGVGDALAEMILTGTTPFELPGIPDPSRAG